MLWVTLAISGIAFVATQVLLFVFAYKYQENANRKVVFFAHSTKLELIWTIIPAITLTILVVIGLRNWFLFTGEAPKNSMIVEVTGKQFGWIYRYPGKDGSFGKKYYKNIDTMLFGYSNAKILEAEYEVFIDSFIPLADYFSKKSKSPFGGLAFVLGSKLVPIVMQGYMYREKIKKPPVHQTEIIPEPTIPTYVNYEEA